MSKFQANFKNLSLKYNQKNLSMSIKYDTNNFRSKRPLYEGLSLSSASYTYNISKNDDYKMDLRLMYKSLKLKFDAKIKLKDYGLEFMFDQSITKMKCKYLFFLTRLDI